MCTLIGCPVGLALGGSFPAWNCCPLQSSNTPWIEFRGVDVTVICFLVFLFFASFFGLYIPLTILCARAGGVPWSLYPTDGECWSEGGSMPYVSLGQMAGFLMGFAACGLLATALKHWLHDRRRRAHCDGSQETGQTTEYVIVA
jgi:hypothetical protein